MIWGMTTSTFTLVHVLLSLIGIGSGFVVRFGKQTEPPFVVTQLIVLALFVALTIVAAIKFPYQETTV